MTEVKKDAMDLLSVAKQTEEICLEAVKQDGLAYDFVRDKEVKNYIIKELFG